MRFAVLILVLSCLIPRDTAAGAWQREPGTGFVSASIRLSWPQDLSHWTSTAPTQSYRTVFFEYGLTRRVTLGLDVGRSVSGGSKTVAFAQFPLRARDSGPKIAAELGLGRIDGTQVFRPGLSIGWGLKRGWFAIDSVSEIGLRHGRTDYKMDITWGRNLPRDRKLIVQLQTGAPDGEAAFARLAPSLVIPIRKNIKLETGVTIGLTGDTSMGVKLGLWSSF